MTRFAKILLLALACMSVLLLPVLAAIPVPGAVNTNIILLGPNGEEASLRVA